MRYLLALLVVLIVYALVDCVRYDNADLPGGLPKAIWVVLIVVFPGAGAIAWLLVSRVTRHAQRAGGPTGPSGGGDPQRPTPRRRHPAPRPVAPDDDPDFLASLDRRRPGPEPEPHEPPEDAVPQDSDDDVDGTATDGADEDGGPGTRH